MEALITDTGGNVVFRKALSASDRAFSWDGTKTDGSAASHGDYRVAVQFSDDNGLVKEIEPLSFLRVKEARMAGDGAQLVLSNGATASPSAVTAVREAINHNTGA